MLLHHLLSRVKSNNTLVSFHCCALTSLLFSFNEDLPSSKGRKIAIDASMSLYQFLIAVRSEGHQLASVDGEPTR